jgi:hypothetical protein
MCSMLILGCVSYDLMFWRDQRDQRPAPASIYHALLAGRLAPDLGQLAIEPTLQALAERFPGIEPPPAGKAGNAVWWSPDLKAVIEFSWSSQHLLAITRGDCTNEQLNSIINICVGVGGARLYDPQINERFDSQ